MNLFSKLKNFFLVLAALLAFSGFETAFAESRTALVIGNGAYRAMGRLANPPADAADFGRTLKDLGFSVTLLVDADLDRMEAAVLAFRKELLKDRNGSGVFFFAGHGIQSQGVNYLLPVDADIQTESQLKRRAVPAQDVLDYMNEARNRFNMVVLDACRNNPLASAFRSSSRGLAVVAAAPPESIIVYSTDAGAVAEDGSGRNSPFTAALIKNIRMPGLDVEAVLRRVTSEVKAATGNRQTPYKYSSLSSDFFFAGPPAVAAVPVQPAARPAPPPVSQPAARPTPEGMVWVEGGTFQMGDTFGDGDSDEKPVHSVTVSGFFMGKNEVTFDEYDAFCADTGKSRPSDQGWGRGSRPVINVSWNDATEYCNWLSRKEGLRPTYSGSGSNISCDFAADGYRLPTEAEWEYAAKGGSRSGGYKYAGGNEAGNVGWYGSNSGGKTHPVGGKQANELGLYDMTGNVWEWCWDWYGSYGTAARTDPRGPSSGDARVSRGGSWFNDAGYVRTAYRYSNDPESGKFYFGFGLARAR